MATGVVSWSQTAATNATADATVNWAEGMAPSQVNDSARAVMASIAKWRDDMAGTLLSSGSNTAFTVATNQVFPSLAALSGQTIVVRFAVSNGIAPTLSVDGTGAKPIQMDSATVVGAGSIRANSIHHLTYDNSISAFILHNGHSLIEPGRIAPHGSPVVSPGWLLCDGTPVSRTTYADLFANITTTYGSTDGATFRVPDLTNLVAVGAGGGVGTLGTTGGEDTHTLTMAELPASPPTGTIGGSQNLGTLLTTAGAQNVGSASPPTINTTGTNKTVQGSNFSFSGDNLGSGTAHNNLQPYLALNYIIKT